MKRNIIIPILISCFILVGCRGGEQSSDLSSTKVSSGAASTESAEGFSGSSANAYAGEGSSDESSLAGSSSSEDSSSDEAATEVSLPKEYTQDDIEFESIIEDIADYTEETE